MPQPGRLEPKPIEVPTTEAWMFNQAQAAEVCAHYLPDGAPILLADRQADIDGFWRVLRSDAARKIRTHHHKE